MIFNKILLWNRHSTGDKITTSPITHFTETTRIAEVRLTVNYLAHERVEKKQWNKIINHTHPFNGPFSGTTRVSRYQKGKTNQDFTGARDSEWQWHQLGRMQACTSLQTDNHASTPLSGGVLARLSVCSEMHTCIWPSWCHCHSLSLASVKSRLVLPFWYRLTWVVLDKGPLNGCVFVCWPFYTVARPMADQLVRMTGWEGGAYATRVCRLADDRPMSRLSDSSLILTSQFRVRSSYTHAAINSNVKHVWPIPVPAL